MTLPKTIAIESAARRLRVSTDRLESLARAGLCPHVLIDGQDLRFQPGKLDAWARGNLWAISDGMKTDRPVFTINRLTAADVPRVPLELANIRRLAIMEVPRPVSGVYFLCLAGVVVYVGQSKSVYSRVPNHTDKDFDSAFFVPIPEQWTHDIEQCFIVLLRPKYNKETILLSANDAALALDRHEILKRTTP